MRTLLCGDLTVVGMVGEQQLLAQEVRGSLGGTSQIDEVDDDTAVGSDQLGCGSGFLAECIPLKTNKQTNNDITAPREASQDHCQNIYMF